MVHPRIISFQTLLFTLLFLVSVVTAKELALTQEERLWITENPIVRIGADVAWPPFEWISNDEHHGVATDYLSHITELTGLQFTLVPNLSWPEVIAGVKHGTVDIAAAVYHNPEWDDFMIFSPPYASFFQVYLVRKNKSLPGDLSRSSGIRIGVGNGYTIQTILEEKYPSHTIVPFDSPEKGVLALATGEIDAYAGNLAVLSYLQQHLNLSHLEISSKVEGIPEAGLHMGMRKDLPLLRSIISKALYAITEEERIAISQKWFGSQMVLSLPEESKELNDEEKRYLEQLKTIRVGVDPDWAPVEYFTPDGELAGITSDNLSILSDTLKIAFDIEKKMSWPEVLNSIKERRIDVIPALAYSDERAEYMLFTRPYLKLPMMIVTQDDALFIDGMEHLATKKIAVVKGYAVQHYIKQDYPDYNIVEYNTLTEAVMAVNRREADAVIGHLAAINLVKSEHNFTHLQVAGTTPYSYDLCFGVRKDMPELVQILEKGLATITPREKAIMLEKWTNIQVKSIVDWKIVSIVIGLVIVIAAFFVIKAVRESYAQKKLLDSTIDSMSDAVLVLNKKYQILRNNRMATELLQQLQCNGSVECLTNISLESKDLKVETLLEILNNEKNSLHNKQFRLRNNSQKMWFSISASPLSIKQGESGVVLIIRDITTQVQKDFQLEQSRKMDAIGQLASGVAHDFNNMLGAIIGSAEILLEDVRDDQKEMLTHIMDAGLKASSLTKQLLLFSRQSTKATTAIDIHSIIEETRFLLSRTIDKRIVVETDLQASNSFVLGDDAQLQNALMNMGINASHAMPEGGSLTFKTSSAELDAIFCENSPFELTPGTFILIEVIDSGTGMTDEVKKRVFEPFFTTKGVGKGTGLGLPAVYAMVEQHHGAISIYSEIGKGTSFHIYLPLSKKEISDGKQVLQELPRGTGSILVVDDEEFIRITVKAMLQSLGYEIVTVENGEEALELLKTERFDAIILDMIMPVMNGRETFEKIVEMEISTPVILSSGFSKEEDVAIMNKKGLFGFLHKPYQRMELSQMVANAIQSYPNLPGKS